VQACGLVRAMDLCRRRSLIHSDSHGNIMKLAGGEMPGSSWGRDGFAMCCDDNGRQPNCLESNNLRRSSEFVRYLRRAAAGVAKGPRPPGARNSCGGLGR